MYKFDKFLDKARNVATIAGKKTGEVVDNSKFKLKAAAVKNDISKIHERIGGLVCQSVKSGEKFDDIISKLVEDAKILEEELCEIEDNLRNEKGTKKCEKCGAICPENAQFCIKCGMQFGENSEKEHNVDENVIDVESEPIEE